MNNIIIFQQVILELYLVLERERRSARRRRPSERCLPRSDLATSPQSTSENVETKKVYLKWSENVETKSLS